MIKCNKCGEEENIILQEYLGAYDGCLILQCNSCNIKTHIATGYEVLAETQLPKLFILSNPETKFPMRYVNQFPYDPKYGTYDKEFEDLEEDLFI